MPDTLANLSLETLWPLLLLPLPLLVYFFTTPREQSKAALQVPFFSRLQQLDSPQLNLQRRSGIRFWLLLFAWLLGVIAMCRPVLLGEAVQLPGKARDLYLAVDISGSMEERDMIAGNRPVQRITLVKQVLGDFIQRRSGDRLGLILFADKAYVQAPLTFDTKTVAQLLQEAQLGFAGQKTAIGDALGLGIQQLVERPADARTIILLTDGANNAGTVSPREAAEVASENGIKVYTVAIGGDPRLQSSLFGSGFLPRRSANIDETTLKQIATVTDGRYFRADNSAELEQIYRELDALEPVDQEAQLLRPRKQVFYWPLALSLALCGAIVLASVLKGLIATGTRRHSPQMGKLGHH